MKGILKKTKEGWFVVFDQRTLQDPSAEDGILPLHPIDVEMIDEDSKVFDHIETRIRTYPEVEFEVRRYDGKSHISNAWNGYAKIIDSYPVSDDCEEVKNWDSFVEQKNAELLAEEYANSKSSSEVFKDAHKKDFIEGYNKAKESYYELLHKSIDCADKKYLEGYNKSKELFKEELAKAYIDGKTNGMDISHPLSMIKEISFDSWYNDNYESKHGEGTSQPLNF
jgi:hypothetical protein